MQQLNKDKKYKQPKTIKFELVKGINGYEVKNVDVKY